MPVLSANTYGKSDVRLTKVVRRGSHHELTEFAVDVRLAGDFAAAYTDGDNRLLVATDSMKNTVYVLAKENAFDSPEAFAKLLAEHFTRTYDQIASAHVEVRQTSWARIDVGGVPHEHSWVNGGRELRTATAMSVGGTTAVAGGVTELLVLKTGNSAFRDFVTDRYRTLPDADDRIMATSVTATWDYADPADYVTAFPAIRTAMLETFATHVSLAVQQTMYEMGLAALAAVPAVRRVSLRLPNKHRIPFDLSRFGLTNGNDIFVWTDEPFGDITAVVERE
jgi:urate oxidase